MKYAEWGANDQKTFKSEWGKSFARNHTDVISLKEGFLANGFQVKVVATKGANCKDLSALFAATSNLLLYAPCSKPASSKPISVAPIFPQSQMLLAHQRHQDLCSPTSTTVALNSLLEKKQIHPVNFANKIHDSYHDIYGNWILNTAEASTYLEDYYVYPKRINTFTEILEQLQKNIPVIVSVKGKIEGAPMAYESGHLMTIVGWDPEKNLIYFIDSAHPSNEESVVSYTFDAFIQAWSIRKNLCYFFEKKSGA